ncbi:unnamed protein product [Blepharisma stoltei]|uniref:Uncharacterized protein n=1 Tax=Blepharisma stoltei TaxID=1481888 RepID=A0AAU9JCR8_9CILI|nr:unnamed protein product [Blepharisma stoltei]
MSLLPMFLKEFEIGGIKINIEQEGNVGIGGMVWDAAFILSKFLAKHQKHVFSNVKNVVELGSGTGLCGIATALLNPNCQVTLTDHRSHISLIDTNIDCNCLKNARSKELDWFHPSNIGKFDLIIGTDLVYDPTLFGPLLDTLDIVSKPNSLILLCNEVRMSRDLDFYKMAQERGWQVTVIPSEFSDPENRNPESPVIRFVKNWK